ncbi:MAG TPA: GNAT family N-acetyltransferase [Gemmatimonadales bacterium]|nr:GNAT family N-acetyltransferase [Gemmatimonadales bacterium]
MSEELRIRRAEQHDAVRLAELSGTLGYPTSAEFLGGTLQRILARDIDVVLVAEAGGTVVGWLHGAEQELLEIGRRCEILGLVVDDQRRGLGAGRKLVDAIECWARARGLTEVSVRSNIIRAESHPFYLRIGFHREKTQHAYRKAL